MPDGHQAPFYALRYDKDGVSTSPLTSDHMISALRDGAFTDVFLFSHGWNNDWDAALEAYQGFIRQFQRVRATYAVEVGRDYRPLLCGVFWPATALVMPWERGPDLAALDDDPESERALRRAIDGLAQAAAPGDRARYYLLMEKPELSKQEGDELVGMLAPVFAAGDGEVDDGGQAARDGTDVVNAWAMLQSAAQPKPSISADPFDIRSPAAGRQPSHATAPGTPQAAGLLDRLDPRMLVRALTVYQMKDRAGLVGSRGVGTLLRAALTAAPHARFHLIGHSYGARVLLNAVSRPEDGELPRPVDSLLLLQAAVNHQCFSAQLADPPHAAGGYRSALSQVRLPILSTFSAHDIPLHEVFHLAVRRGKDLGDIGVAADPDEPPSKYAALGGYGPRGAELDWRATDTKLPLGASATETDFYDVGPGAPRVWALNGRASIRGHGDVVTPTTAWALLSLVRGS